MRPAPGRDGSRELFGILAGFFNRVKRPVQTRPREIQGRKYCCLIHDGWFLSGKISAVRRVCFSTPVFEDGVLKHTLQTRSDRCYARPMRSCKSNFAVILHPMTPGIHLLHKPIGPTSFSLVQSCMEQLVAKPSGRMPRICHGGTLDPFASGLLLILVEPATKLFDHLHAIPKAYDATVQWGTETDNGDLHGRATNLHRRCVQSHTPTTRRGTGDIRRLARSNPPPHQRQTHRRRTRLSQSPPRRNRHHAPIVRVYMHECNSGSAHDLPRQSRLRMTVRGGYYVRAFARDLGRLLGCGAHLTALHRSAIGPWTDPGPGHSIEIHGRDLLPWAQTRILTDAEVGELRQNKMIPTGELQPPDWPLPPGFSEPNAPDSRVSSGEIRFSSHTCRGPASRFERSGRRALANLGDLSSHICMCRLILGSIHHGGQIWHWMIVSRSQKPSKSAATKPSAKP